MSETLREIEELTERGYQYGWHSDLDTDVAPPGLNEDVVRLISAKKNEPEWLLDWRLAAYEAWTQMDEPDWAKLNIAPIDYQSISYWAAPKPKPVLDSMDDVDPEIREMFDKLGIPLHEQKMLSNVAVDAIVDSVSVTTTFKATLAEAGVIFCSFSEAVHDYPDLVREHLGSVVPVRDNYFAALNSAVFSDGSFCYIPKGVRCPMELSTYFRINSQNTGQFERTLIVAEDDSHVSYLEGCTAPQRDENQLHAAVVELVAKDRAEIKYSTVQNWYPGDENGVGGIYNFVTKRGRAHDRRQDLVDAGRDRLGDHVEVPERHPAGRPLRRRVLLGGPVGPAPAGRHGHQDGPHRQGHDQHDHLEGHLDRPRPEHLPRSGQGDALGGERPQLHPVRLAAARQEVRGAHDPVHRGQEPERPDRTRSVHVHRRRGPAVLLPPARHVRRRCDVDDRQRLLP